MDKARVAILFLSRPWASSCDIQGCLSSPATGQVGETQPGHGAELWGGQAWRHLEKLARNHRWSTSVPCCGLLHQEGLRVWLFWDLVHFCWISDPRDLFPSLWTTHVLDSPWPTNRNWGFWNIFCARVQGDTSYMATPWHLASLTSRGLCGRVIWQGSKSPRRPLIPCGLLLRLCTHSSSCPFSLRNTKDWTPSSQLMLTWQRLTVKFLSSALAPRWQDWNFRNFNMCRLCWAKTTDSFSFSLSSHLAGHLGNLRPMHLNNGYVRASGTRLTFGEVLLLVGMRYTILKCASLYLKKRTHWGCNYRSPVRNVTLCRSCIPPSIQD